jgi:uncharacterized protein (TIGR02300 family)
VAKAEWGTKRLCTSCGARFYDLRRDPIVCPSCGAVYNPELVARPRRARPAVTAAAKGAAALAVDDEVSVVEDAEVDVEEVEEDGDLEGDEAVEETEEDEETEDNDAMIEDASELGEDDEMTDIDTGLEDEDER